MNGSFVVLNIQIFVRLDIRVWHIPKGLSDFVFYGKKFKNKSIVSFDSDTNASHDELFFTCVKYSAIWWRWYFVIGLWHSGQSRRFWHQRSAVRIQSSAIILYYIWLLLTVWMWGRWWTFKNEVSLKLIHKVFLSVKELRFPFSASNRNCKLVLGMSNKVGLYEMRAKWPRHTYDCDEL